jgi:protein SCO1
MRPTLFILLLIVAAGPVRAGLTSATLDAVRAAPPDGATLDLGTGRPTVLVFADFDCGVLCDAILAQTGQELMETGLTPGVDYVVAVIGIDPGDAPRTGKTFAAGQLPPKLLETAILRTPGEEELAAITRGLGYGYAYDAEADRFAHPAVRYVLAPSGRVTAVLPPFEVTPAEMREAVGHATDEQPSFAVRLLLLCYGLDPASGRYAPLVLRTMMILGCLTPGMLAAGLAAMRWRERRRPPA